MAVGTIANLKPEQRAFKPWGSAEEFMYCKDRIVGLDGPAGTGKSRVCLEKIHLLMEKYPGARAVILRKTRESLTEAALFTFEEKVVPKGHPILTDVKRNFRQNYIYPNGSEIVIGGLDKPQKVMSTEYDIAYIQEAIECNEDDIEYVLTRLRNGVVPYQQLTFDCNPDKPLHWINQRGLVGTITLIHSKHQDNPVLYDHEREDWTPAGKSYLETLSMLTGARKERLLDGKWVASEGQIYTSWDPDVHLVARNSADYGLQHGIPREWARYWTIDWGYTHPFVWQAWAEDPDGRLIRYREIYRTGKTVNSHAKDVLSVCGYEIWKGRVRPVVPNPDPLPHAIICDHDPGDREIFEQETGLRTVKAYKEVTGGIQAVQRRFQIAGDGKPRLIFLRDSLVEEDPELAAKRRPTCAEQEVDGYVWDEDLHGEIKQDKPKKQDDHGMDTTRYLVCHVDKIAELKAGDVPAATPASMRVVGIRGEEPTSLTMQQETRYSQTRNSTHRKYPLGTPPGMGEILRNIHGQSSHQQREREKRRIIRKRQPPEHGNNGA